MLELTQKQKRTRFTGLKTHPPSLARFRVTSPYRLENGSWGGGGGVKRRRGSSEAADAALRAPATERGEKVSLLPFYFF